MVRVKHRYLTVQYLYPATLLESAPKDLPTTIQFRQPTPDDFGAGRLVQAIRAGVEELYGDYGLGMVNTGLKVNYHSTATSTSIIRCPQAHYQMVWAALTYMTKLPKPANTPVVVRVIRVSGTIKKAEEEVIRRAKQTVLQMKMIEAGMAEGTPVNAIMNAVEKSVTKEDARNVLAEVDEGEATEEET
ncbi:hypothetical protein EJ04DRAFT_223993 [Polyplosphaeria fusca]|uniref:Ribonuclease P/MRP protein subunit POP5 n=1 Tax=Polyplosphaeria fusca TaxID=682080 RepID=A0A9P4V1W1_9PLEO|nr:hypothetical protein EJ04DRAFT_223993 [Polyplosphaeria fusca]